MKKNKFALQFIFLVLIISSFIACNKDFATLDSDIVNQDNATNFDITKSQYEIITHNRVLGPVQTNAQGLNSLGVYDDAYGKTTASFVTQMTTSFPPTFGESIVLDSVVMYLPFFATVTEVQEDGNILFTLDSVFGDKPIKLSVFESNYFLRDFVPDADFSETQAYFSNKSLSESNIIPDALLEGTPIEYYNEDGTINTENIIEISDKGYVLTVADTEDDTDTDPQVSQRLSPGIRLILKPDFWQEKILDQEGETVLSSQNNFNEYFRGLYFKAEAVNNEGSYLIMNVGSQNSSVTLYYTRDTPSTTDDPEETEQVAFTLGLGPTRVNFLENDFNLTLTDGDEVNGDSRLYIKGGEGSLGNIKLFNGEDLDDDSDTFNTFESWKNEFVETDVDGKFVKSKRLVNEANLVFYVDPNLLDGNEPDRIYLYDIDNKTPLVDYFLDGINNTIPSFSVSNHLGVLQRVDGEGVKYKLKVTEHINNMLIRDSTNVNLGLSVSLNVNLEENFQQREVLSDDESLKSPISSILSPKGTILHGNNTEDESKKVYLEIYYTEPNN